MWNNSPKITQQVMWQKYVSSLSLSPKFVLFSHYMLQRFIHCIERMGSIVKYIQPLMLLVPPRKSLGKNASTLCGWLWFPGHWKKSILSQELLRVITSINWPDMHLLLSTQCLWKDELYCTFPTYLPTSPVWYSPSWKMLILVNLVQHALHNLGQFVLLFKLYNRYQSKTGFIVQLHLPANEELPNITRHLVRYPLWVFIIIWKSEDYPMLSDGYSWARNITSIFLLCQALLLTMLNVEA